MDRESFDDGESDSEGSSTIEILSPSDTVINDRVASVVVVDECTDGEDSTMN